MSQKKNSIENPENRSINHIRIKKDKKSFNDLRFKKSGFKKCMQCGRCTASCPAAYIYPDYNPRDLMRHFMFNDINSEVEEVIWKCGQCYSCRARCPRNSKVGLGVLALQSRSVSEGNAPLEILNLRDTVKENLYQTGETFLPYTLNLDNFQKKTKEHWKMNLKKRKHLGFVDDNSRKTPLPSEDLKEIRKIMELTGFI